MGSERRITVLVAFTGDGGVETMIANLVSAWLDDGVQVDVLLIKARGRHVARLPSEARVFYLNAWTSLAALPAVASYLRRYRPAAMLAAKDRAGRLAILARWIAGVPTRVVIRLGMHLSGSLAQKSQLRRWSRWLPARCLYPYADGFIAVSDEVADDISEHARLDRERFAVIPNPAVPPDIGVRKAAPVRHDWLSADASLPVVLACGRLAPQKDFITLLRAFAAVRERLAARLIILGEGPERARLTEVRNRLGLDPWVDLPGFVDDVLPWMARADVFVLSSAYEGSPNVLVEAMACGMPVVATDCPSGPARILRGGLLGPLVPVGNAERLADAICSTLAEPVPVSTLIDAVSDYDTVTSARRYLAFLRC